MMEMTIDAPIWGGGSPKMFGWQEHGFGRLGVGVREDILRKYEDIRIYFNKGSIKFVDVHCDTAINLSETYNAVKTAMGGVRLLIFPVFAFPVNKEPRPDKEKKELEVKLMPILTFMEMTALRKYFNKFLTYKEVKEVEQITREQHDKAFIDVQWKKVDKLAKKLRYWKRLTLEKYGKE